MPKKGNEPFAGECEPLVPVNVLDQIEWIKDVSHETWPMWNKGTMTPSVVLDPTWESLPEKTQPIVSELLKLFPGCHDTYRAITTIHPGDYVPHHTDTLVDGWVTRIHVPLVTNPGAWFVIGGKEYHLDVGMSYQVNPSIPHAVRNQGDTSRVHLMFDVVR